MKRLPPGVGGIGPDVWFRVLDLDVRALLAEARRRTRLENLAEDETFHEAFGLLVRSYEAEAHLNFIGRVAARQDILRLLMNRLRLVEDRKRRPEIESQEIRRPLFLTGLPGSGTTFLHALLAQDPDNRVPLHWESFLPSPPPERTSHAADPRIVAAERQLLWLGRLQPKMRRIHRLDARLPVECSVITTHCFVSFEFQAVQDVPTYEAWLEHGELARSSAWHRRFLQHLQSRCPGARWVLSGPAHLFGLDALFATYPDARVVFTHRDPVDACASSAKLTAVLRSAFSDAVDPAAVGREVTERWATAMERACRYRDSGVTPAARFLDVRYDDLVSDPVGTVRRLYAYCNVPLTRATVERLRAFVEVSATERQDPYGACRVGSGLEARIAERYRGYRERFAV